MNTNELRPKYAALNAEVRRRLTIMRDVAEKHGAEQDSWDANYMNQVIAADDDTERSLTQSTVMVKFKSKAGSGALHGSSNQLTMKVKTSVATSYDAVQDDEGNDIQEFTVSTTFEAYNFESAGNPEFSIELLHMLDVSASFHEGFAPMKFTVIRRTAAEREASVRAEAERLAASKTRLILADAIKVLVHGMRVTTAPRTIPLALIPDVKPGTYKINLGHGGSYKEYTVTVHNSRANVRRES